MRKIDRLFAAVAEGDIRLASYYLGLEGPCSKTYVSELDEPKFCHPLCHCDKCVSLEELSYEKETKPPIAINAVNSRGETALHIASAVGSTEIIQVCDSPTFHFNILEAIAVEFSFLHIDFCCKIRQVLINNVKSFESKSQLNPHDFSFHPLIKSISHVTLNKCKFFKIDLC